MYKGLRKSGNKVSEAMRSFIETHERQAAASIVVTGQLVSKLWLLQLVDVLNCAMRTVASMLSVVAHVRLFPNVTRL